MSNSIKAAILERPGGFGGAQADGEPYDEGNAHGEFRRWEGGGRQCLM